MSKFTVLKSLILKYKYRLLYTYILFSLEMLALILRPFFLGMAVDNLMEGSYNGLMILIVSHVLYSLVGTIRHMYDTRTYSAIYTSLVTRFISNKMKKTDVSKMSAHSNLAREFVDFLETDFVYVLEAFYNIFGSLLLLFIYDRSVMLICLAILFPVLALSYIYGKKMQKLTQNKNDELEKQVDIIATYDPLSIKEHYNNLRKWQIKISDKEAWNFGFMELMVIAVVGAALVITHLNYGIDVAASTIIIFTSYVQRFVSGLDTIPYIVQRLTSLSDITNRLELQVEDINDDKIVKIKTQPKSIQSLVQQQGKKAS